MTGLEKEIIINGIDVSECKNFSCGICEEENKKPRTIGHFTADCTFYPNCYFKQLKRLQQELDIKEKMLDKFMIGSGETLEKLQKENEKLKENQCCPETCEYIATEIIRYTNVCEVNSKYRQALEEIIDIAEKLITETPEYHSCYYKDECGDNCTPKKQSKVEYCCYENVDKILTIINEALNEQK